METDLTQAPISSLAEQRSQELMVSVFRSPYEL